jgi:hypothetical protein
VPEDAIRQYTEEYQARRDARLRRKNEVENAWEEGLRVQQFVRTAIDPTAITNIWRGEGLPALQFSSLIEGATRHLGKDASLLDVAEGFGVADNITGAFSGLPFGDLIGDIASNMMADTNAQAVGQAATAVQQEFIDNLELAFEQHGEEIPLSWFMQYEPNDLLLLGGPEFKEVSEKVYSVQQEMAAAEQSRIIIEQEVQRRAKEAERNNNFWRRASNMAFVTSVGVPLGFLLRTQVGDDPDLDELRAEQEAIFYGKRDTLFDEEIGNWMEEQRVELEERWLRKPVPAEVDPATLVFGGDVDAERRQRIIESNDKLPTTMRFIDEEIPVEEWVERVLEERERWIRREVVQNPNMSIREILNQRGLGSTFAGLAMDGVGWVFDKGMGVVAFAMENAPGQRELSAVGEAAGLTLTVPDYLRDRWDTAQQEFIEDLTKQIGNPDEAALRRAASIGAQSAWEELEIQGDPLINEYLAMAAGDQTMAMGFFASDVNEQEEVRNQLADMSKTIDDEARQFLEEVNEQDFRLSSELLNLLSMWGRNIPGRLATAASLMLADSDYWDPSVLKPQSDLWNQLGEDVSMNNFSPAATLGIDGSLSGLFLDLTGGVAFDPTTWIFGPRLKPGGALATTADDAARLATSPLTRRFIDDVAQAYLRPDQGAYQVYHLTSWMDDVSRGEFALELGINPQVVAQGVRVPGTRMVQVKGFLDELVPEGAIIGGKRKGGVIKSKEAKALADDMKSGAFKEAVEVTYSRADGTLHLTDGVKRTLAAQQEGISHLPVKLKIVDESAAGAPRLAGYSDEGVGVIEDIAKGDFPFAKAITGEPLKVSKNLIDEATQADVIAAADFLESRGLGVGVGTVTDAEGVTYQLMRAAQKGGDGAGSVTYYAIDEFNDIVAAVTGRAGEAIGEGGVSAAYGAQFLNDLGRSGIMSQMWDIATSHGDNFILQNVDELSKSGARFLESYAKRLLNRAHPQLNTAGRNLDDMLRPGESIKKPLKKVGAGDQTVVVDSVLPNRLLYGDINTENLTKIVETAIGERGVVPTGAARGAINAGFADGFRNALRTVGLEQAWNRWARPHSTVRNFQLTGTNSFERLTDAAVRMWGTNTAKANVWLERIYRYQMREAAAAADDGARMRALGPRRRQVAALQQRTGGAWGNQMKEYIKAVDELKAQGADDATIQAAKLKRDQFSSRMEDAQAELTAAQKSLEALDAKYLKKIHAYPERSELAKIVQEMWEDFNRTEIAPNWLHTGLVDDTGLLPWEHLSAGRPKTKGTLPHEGVRHFIPEKFKDIAEEIGENAEALSKQLSATLDQPISLNVPASPLEMIGASTVSGAAWRQFTKMPVISSVREISHALHIAWVTEKVLTPATAMVVSFDELLRMFHIGGAPLVSRWMADRALFVQARANAMLHGKNPLGKNAVRKGAEYMTNPRIRERIVNLQDYSTRLKQAERSLFDNYGLGWTDITPDDPFFYEAAQRWTGNLLQDTGFRAYLRGPDAFRDWWFSTDGSSMRQASVLAKASDDTLVTKTLSKWEDAYEGWDTLFDKIILKKAKDNGVYKEVHDAWRTTAEKIARSGGHPSELPTLALDNLAAVRGVQKLGDGKDFMRLTDAFFDRFFMDPINYRRGLLAETVRASERQRLLGLYATNGKYRVVNDLELDEALGLKGMGGMARGGTRQYVWEQALKNGIVPESYIDDLVERAVERELDNVLYTWDRGTRAGKASTALFPFGRPWADMAGFWGREMFRKPHLRGWVNKTNFLWMREAKGLMNPVGRTLNAATGLMNWRTPALMSRLAATDFTVDEGFIGEGGGLLPGTESSDISPLFFLPTGGENPFGTVIPGLGFLPMAFLDWAMSEVYDPVENPTEYAALVDSIGDFIPSAHFGSPKLLDSVVRRAIGGGTIARSLEVGADVLAWQTGQSFFGFNSLMGDIGREVDRNRQMSAILADPEEWDAIFSITDLDDLDIYMHALSVEADRRAAAGNIGRSVTRVFAPTTNKFDQRLDVLHDVWVNAAQQFPAILGVRPSFDIANIDKASDEEIARYAGDVRTAFFRLEQDERDMVIAGYPQVAVNLVSSWEWTPEAQTAGIDGSDIVYRTDGSREGLIRHQTFIDMNYIRPIEPIERARRIIGLANAAKESVAKAAYEIEVGRINDFWWETLVTDKTKTMLDAMMEGSPIGEFFDVRTAKELWERWGSREEDLEEILARGLNIDDEELIDGLKSLISIPQSQKSLGTTWPGLDSDNLNKTKFAAFPFTNFGNRTNEILGVLGIDLDPSGGVSGEQLFTELQQFIANETGVVHLYVRPAYDTYVGERTAPARAAEAEISKHVYNQRFDEEWREELQQFLIFAESVGKRFRDDPLGIPPLEMLDVQQRYLTLRNTADSINTDWDRMWDLLYKRQFGPLEWQPLEPLAPKDDAGNTVAGAFAPYIKNVVDGDTIVVATRPGSSERHQIRLLGVRARDYGLDDEGAQIDKDRLWDALQAAQAGDDRIWLVRDPDNFGNVDPFGRVLAWLWIGDEPFWFPDELNPARDPSGPREEN